MYTDLNLDLMDSYKPKDFKYKKMLTHQSAKACKSEKFGHLTAMLYLAPYTQASDENRKINLCPNAQNADCFKHCLNFSGRGRFNSIQQSRIDKTHYFYDSPELAIANLIHDIKRLERLANKNNLKLSVRLNATSDRSPVFGGYPWELIPVQHGGKVYKNIFDLFSHVQFYDYTKLPRITGIENYHLTASYSASSEYRKTNNKAFRLGLNVAVVFENEKPKYFHGRKVIDGDKHDIRFLDQKNVVVGLSVKKTSDKSKNNFFVN